jgi:hypothetical protein
MWQPQQNIACSTIGSKALGISTHSDLGSLELEWKASWGRPTTGDPMYFGLVEDGVDGW